MTNNPLSCDMIIIDDVIALPPTPEQKATMLKWYQDYLKSRATATNPSSEV